MEKARDKNGKTESEFLRGYDATKYFRPSVTVDAVLFCPEKTHVSILLIKRGGHPYMGDFAFPGGFVEENESCETAVLRELEEETGVTDVPLSQLVTVSTPQRDPRYRSISVVYSVELNDIIVATGGDDAASAEWFDVTCSVDRSNGKETATLEFDGCESFEVLLDVCRDRLGDIDLNATDIVRRGRIAFDHAKIIYFLLDKFGVIK